MIGHLCTDLFTDAECDPNSFPADDVMAVHRTPSHDGRLYIKPINLGCAGYAFVGLSLTGAQCCVNH